MTKQVDPDLAPDASLATDLGDEEQRRLDQIAHLGGEVDDDIDNWDPSDLDDGSDFDPANPTPDNKDEEDDDDSEKDDSEDDADDSDGGDPDSDDNAADGDKDEKEEKDPDPEDDDDSDDEGADAEATTGKQKIQGIPRHRFNEVNERMKAAEAKIAQLEAEKKAGDEAAEEKFDFDTAEKEYMDLMLDGDTEKALAKRNEIRAAERAEFIAETKNETKQEIAASDEDAELLALSQEATEMFDVFNPDHESFDQALLNRVMVYYRGYSAEENVSKSDAFVWALSDVIEANNLMPPEDDGKEGDTEAKPTGKTKKDPKKEEVRKQAHQPAGTEGTGSNDAGAVAPDVTTMTDEEFDALPAATQAKLRGDIL